MPETFLTLKVNGFDHTVASRPGLTLMKYLREDLDLTGTKCGCGAGDCGTCKVLVNGEARTSCNLPLSRLDGAEILTVEGLAGTAGPSTVHPVQQAFIDAGAVQCGFCTPGMIITTVDLLSRNPVPGEKEIRQAFQGNLCRCTGYAKIVDAVKIASGQMAPPVQSDGVGGFSPVTQVVSKVTGRLRYTADRNHPRALTGKILYAPAPHGVVTKIDTQEALALEGVVDVVTFEDIPDRPFNSHITVPFQDVPKNERIFNKHFRYRGDRIAAVAAVDEATARRALKLIKVEFDKLPFLRNPREALEPQAPAIHEGGNSPARISDSSGEIPEGEEGVLIYEEIFRTGRVTHAAMEPHAVNALYEDEILTVYSSCQNVFCYQAMLAELFDLPFNRVRVIKPPVGGAFGGKSEMVLEPVASLLALRTGFPVKMAMTRREVFSSTRTRTPVDVKTRISVGNDGLFREHDYQAVMDRGAYFGSGFDLGYAFMDKAYRLYRVPRIATNVKLAYTNNQPPGAMRGYGNPQLSFAREVLIDRICRDRGWDPVEFRLANLVHPGDKNPSTGGSLGAAYPAECLRAGAEKFRWEERKRLCHENNSIPGQTLLRGVGAVSGVHGAGIYPGCVDYSTAAVKLFPDGSAVLTISAHENGQGSSILMKKILSSCLDIPEEKISLAETDTLVTFYDNGSYASRETWVCGQAVLQAGETMKKLLLEEGARMFGCAAGDVEFCDGSVRFKYAEGKSASLSELVRHAQTSYPFRDMAVIESVPCPFDPGAYFANFAEVEVNRETGKVRVLDFLAVHNSGTPINPVMLEGQVEGGLHMGLGFALSEELDVDPETGDVRNGNFRKYGFFRASEMPETDVLFLDNPEEPGPYGAKSIGEATTGGVAPAVVNAVSHATGLDFSTLPVRAEDVLAGLKILNQS